MNNEASITQLNHSLKQWNTVYSCRNVKNDFNNIAPYNFLNTINFKVASRLKFWFLYICPFILILFYTSLVKIYISRCRKRNFDNHPIIITLSISYQIMTSQNIQNNRYFYVIICMDIWRQFIHLLLIKL